MRLPSLFPLAIAAALATACSADAPASADMAQTADTAVPDSVDSDIAVQSEVVPPPAPIFRAWYDAFLSVPEPGPAVYLSTTEINGPNLVTLFVKGRDLGLIAGLAFYLEYDPAIMRLEAYESHVDLGNSGPYFTQSVTHELSAGKITYGAARFCKAKIPWGSTDQCGGQEIVEETTIATFTFALLKPGESMVRFPQTHTLVRRPDRERVTPAWVGGTLVVHEEVTQ
jgi:hypothetical protein